MRKIRLKIGLIVFAFLSVTIVRAGDTEEEDKPKWNTEPVATIHYKTGGPEYNPALAGLANVAMGCFQGPTPDHQYEDFQNYWRMREEDAAKRKEESIAAYKNRMQEIIAEDAANMQKYLDELDEIFEATLKRFEEEAEAADQKRREEEAAAKKRRDEQEAGNKRIQAENDAKLRKEKEDADAHALMVSLELRDQEIVNRFVARHEDVTANLKAWGNNPDTGLTKAWDAYFADLDPRLDQLEREIEAKIRSGGDLAYKFTSPDGDFKEHLKVIYRSLTWTSPTLESDRKIKDIGLFSVEEADRSYASGETEEASFWKTLGEESLEILVGLNPTTGFVQSFYELVTGLSIITGEEVGAVGRSFAFLGVVTLGGSKSIATVGSAMSKVYRRAATLLRDRHALETAVREGTMLAEKAGVLIRDWKKSHKIINIHTAEHMNTRFPASWLPRPFQFGSHVVEFTTLKETQWVRVHTASNQPGSWVMRESAIEGLTPKQIADKFGLGDRLPTHVSDVHVPKDTLMVRGNVGNIGEAPEGAIQYYIKEVDPDWFKNMRLL